MSNRLFQTIVHQMKDVVGRAIGVIDENGIVIASSELGRIGESRQRVKDELPYSEDTMFYDGYTYRFIDAQEETNEIIFVEGEDAHAVNMCKLIAISLSNIKGLYDDKYDKGSFIKNIILDNILPSDIYVKSNELHFNTDDKRAVLVVKFQNVVGPTPYEVIDNLIEDKTKDYVISISEQDIVVVKEVSEDATTDDVEEFAKALLKDASAEIPGAKLLIGVSSIVDNLRDLAKAYKEAKISLEVGKVFDIEHPVMSYENLGIGRLIYQLPSTLCEIFLSEVFKRGSLDSLDRETLMTVQSFFENNLNVSETSRKLFVHRNTLVYRLEKIRKLTGLDLREFEHAVTFKVALMVKKYLTTKPTKF